MLEKCGLGCEVVVCWCKCAVVVGGYGGGEVGIIRWSLSILSSCIIYCAEKVLISCVK